MILRVVAATLSNPLLLASVLEGSGLLLLRTSRRRMGVYVILAGVLLAYLASTTLVGDALLAPLEEQYAGFAPTQDIGVRDIVVLGSGYEPQDRIPVTGALDREGLTRLVEGVRLARARPDSRLLVSGGAPPGFTPSALGYTRMAAELGIQPSALIVMDRALDTAQEARDVVSLLGHSRFVLVTSAYHMPRAMRLMRRAGANPVPAPTGQMLHEKPGIERFGLIPGSRGLLKTEAALHEYLGLAAVSLRLD
jgi:uncharacterized SAM-binding protein YcdF (DUF218 family)